jgi:hypothetical protein
VVAAAERSTSNALNAAWQDATCQTGGFLVADPFKAFLFVKCGLVIAVSFSVGFDQAEHRVLRDRSSGSRRRQRDGDGLRDVARRHRSSGKTAGANDAADCSDGKELSSRRIYGRSCAILEVSLGQLTHPHWFELEPGWKLTLPPGLQFVYTGIMKKAISVHKKPRGRPASGQDPLISARIPSEVISAMEAWRAKQGVTRSEAIRRLVELGLKAKGK